MDTVGKCKEMIRYNEYGEIKQMFIEEEEYKGLPSDEFEESWGDQFWVDEDGQVHLQD